MFYWLGINGKRMAKDLLVAFFVLVNRAGSSALNRDLYNWE
jgi:hypothetical protein